MSWLHCLRGLSQKNHIHTGCVSGAWALDIPDLDLHIGAMPLNIYDLWYGCPIYICKICLKKCGPITIGLYRGDSFACREKTSGP